MLIGVYPRSSAAHKRFFHSFQGSGCPRWSKRVQREESDMFNFSSEQFRLNVGLAEMLKGGVIMDVTNVEQAKIAEDAGASAHKRFFHSFQGSGCPRWSKREKIVYG